MKNNKNDEQKTIKQDLYQKLDIAREKSLEQYKHFNWHTDDWSEHALLPGPEFEEFNYDLSTQKLPVTLLSYYLPQFYPFKENDDWWGKGFTEWRNCTKAKPRFKGHYQPHLPRDLGYYDLRLPEIMKQQADLAKKSGISAWCFYHYNFGNRRIMEKPVNHFLDDKSIDMQFCIMWAN